jgi:hypothetical protein
LDRIREGGKNGGGEKKEVRTVRMGGEEVERRKRAST